MARKIAHASELLARSDLPTERVAAAAGFRNTAQLRRYFQQLKGQTPRDFRRQPQ
ncbi:helix-turn-helix domain-containing protein (plasmid) [Sphingomonas naphthae]|uniref:Helix-turn-helix domain-containing protein n=1 Tax=Sphingomonas naphthae TaxID=1813468 RepID=A0ABY7TRI7_9SPHN|nr:helix-turn-helix domain-containing protein [Sphingomonas naphthae]WCT75826.1 helix-turn-helix domain-containing protein [Sphingomonas naphthae]